MINMNLNLRTAAELAAGAEFLQRLALCAPTTAQTVKAEFVPTLTPAEAEKLEVELEQHHAEAGNQPPLPVAPHIVEAPAPAKRRGRPPKAAEPAPAPAPSATIAELVNTVGPDVDPEPAPIVDTPPPPPARLVTADDVRRAMGDYVKKFGMAAAQEDGPALLKGLFGEGVGKISAIPADGLEQALIKITEMTVTNPHKRAVVA